MVSQLPQATIILKSTKATLNRIYSSLDSNLNKPYFGLFGNSSLIRFAIESQKVPTCSV